MSEPDYTGVPLYQVRRLISKFVGEGKHSKNWLVHETGINIREMTRIIDKAKPTAILGLHKVDTIVHGLGYQLAALERSRHMTIVPMGAGMVNARRMAEDHFEAQGQSYSSADVEEEAKSLMKKKHHLLDFIQSQPMTPLAA